LLLNSVAGEALPIFLHNLVPEFAAILISVVLVLIMGEIVPAAIFTGPGQLVLASRLAPLVKLCMFLLWPIVWPIAQLLDMFFSNESQSREGFNRHELAALIRIQHEERIATKQRRQLERNQLGASVTHLMEDMDLSHTQVRDLTQQSTIRDPKKRHTRNASIHIDEINMMEGALQMKTKVAIDIYLSYRKVYAISIDTVLDEVNTMVIYSSGFSRVPVYEGKDKTRIKGILMTRNLIVVNTSDVMPLSRLPLHIPQCVPPDINLVDLVNLFQTGGCANRVGHMALVCAMPDIGNAALDKNEPIPQEAGLMGIITLEDVLESLLQEQIYDEMDVAGRLRLVPSQFVEEPIDENACYTLM
jgi:metal transporter CNNM